MNKNTILYEQSTPVNQNPIGNNYLFGNTTAVTPTNFFEKKEESTTILQTSRTFQKYDSIIGLNKNDYTNISNVTTITSPTLNSFLFDTKPSTSIDIVSKKENKFLFGNNQLSTTISPNFTLGNSSSFFPNTTRTNTPFTFSLSKRTRRTSSTATIPMLFSTMNESKSSPLDLQLYQTMVNTRPFNNELAFLARNVKPNFTLDRARFSTTSNPPINNLFPSVLIKPYITNKRKYDEDDDETLLSTNQIPKINIKRPRMLDMNKIRSIVLGHNENPIEWKQELPLPRLTRHDYFTKPTIEELKSSFNDQGQCFVKQFTIGRKHYGSVTFQGLSMNLAGLDLDQLVEINRRQVTVYPNDKDRPNEGEELNCQAIISLIGVYPIDRSILNSGEEVTDPDRLIEMNYGKYLEKMTNKFQGQFLDYDIYTGTWTFQVEHF